MSENSLESQLGALLAFTGALGGRRCDAAAVSRSEGFGTRPASNRVPAAQVVDATGNLCQTAPRQNPDA